MTEALGGAVAVVLTAAGVLVLRRAWSNPGHRSLVCAGWLSLAAAGLGWMALAAADKAVAFAMLTPSPVAFVVVAGGADLERRTKRRPARDSVELAAGRPDIRRSLSRTLLAGPVSAVTALAVAMLVATKAPLGDAARLIASGLLAPALWAGFMAWALYDSRLDRVFAALAMIALIGGAGIFL